MSVYIIAEIGINHNGDMDIATGVWLFEGITGGMVQGGIGIKWSS